MKHFVKYYLILALLFFFGSTSLAQRNCSGNKSEPVARKTQSRIDNNYQKQSDTTPAPYSTWKAASEKFDPQASIQSESDRNLIPPAKTVSIPLWQTLEKMELADKENASIQLETSAKFELEQSEEIKNIETLWNSGNYQAAISKLRSLTEVYPEQAISCGIAWKSFRSVLAPNWGTDVQIGSRSFHEDEYLDFDAATGNLFAVLRRVGGDSPRWTVNFSSDGGVTWQETYTYSAGTETKNISATVVGGYLFVAYVSGSGLTDARLRRFYVSNGTSDTGFGYVTVFNKGINIREVALCSNADYSKNRIYYGAILENNSYYLYWDDPAGQSWTEINPNINNCSYGLALTYNYHPGSYFLYYSYVNTSDRLIVVRVSGSQGEVHESFNLDDARIGGTGVTSISAFEDVVIVAFEYTYTNGDGIRYNITYDGGASWFYGSIAEPAAGQKFCGPSVTSRKGGGIALIYHEEVGEPDICWFTHRADYQSTPWSVPEQFNEIDIWTGTPMSVQWIPPFSGSNPSYGAVWTHGQALFDRLDGTISQPTWIHVTYPNGGETWYVGTAYTITWTSDLYMGQVMVEITTNDGDGWWDVTQGIFTANDGSYTYTPNSGDASTRCRFRVRSIANLSVQDRSDDLFTIVEPGPTPSITVTSPNGGEQISCAWDITWTSTNISSNVKIEYLCNNISMQIIANNTPNDGHFHWNVPQGTSCSEGGIKISDAQNSNYFDWSDTFFNINCPAPACEIQVTYPNGGQTIGCNATITWASANTSGSVKIEYYCINGSWQTITNSTPDDGSYNWTVPQGLCCSQAWLRVSDANNSSCSDENDANFAIDCGCPSPCTITVIKPNGGEYLACGTHTILWSSTDASGNVRIEYLCNGSWQTITSSTPNDGSWPWTISPTIQCSDAKVRITDTTEPSCTDLSDTVFRINCGGPCVPPYLKVEDVAGVTGNTISVVVNLKGNLTGIDAFGFKLTYCNDKLSYQSAQRGDLTNYFSFFQVAENTPGLVTVGGFDNTAIPAYSEGSMVILSFTVTQCELGEICTLELIDLVDDLLGITPCNGNFICEAGCDLGDVNEDGNLTPGDALCAFQIYLNGGTPPPGDCNTPCALEAADANCDGAITPGDALVIFQGYLDGLPLPLECPPTGLAKETAERSLKPGQIIGIPGEEVTVALQLDNPADLQAFGLDLGFPDELLTFVNVSRTRLTEGWQTLNAQENLTGVLTIGGYGSEAISTTKSGALVKVIFRVKEEAAGFGELWVFNPQDDLAEASFSAGQFSVELNGLRQLGNGEIPTTFALEQNYPNPFNMETEIVYQVPESGYIEVTLYNSLGQKIRTLVSQEQSAGRYAARWDGLDEQGQEVTSGIYFYRLVSSEFSQMRKMLLIK